jgi:hypothetical protein
LPPPPSWPSTSKEPFSDLDLEAQLEQDLGLDEDAVGEPDDDLEHSVLRQEEEEDEMATPLRAPSPPKSNPQRPAKPNAAPAKSRSVPTKEKGKAKREYADTSYGEEENLEFGRPAQQTKHLRPSEGLALPGSFSAPSPLADPPSSQLPPFSDSDEDWDEVAAAEPAPATPLQHDVYVEEGGEGEDMEEIDVTAFEAEMNETLEEDEEDFLAAAVGAEVDPPPSDHPTSISQFAGGEPSQDEDDFSSSEESDDE